MKERGSTSFGERKNKGKMLTYAEVHRKAIEEAENLLKQLHAVTEEALLEEKSYCDGYTLLKNSYPVTQRRVTREEITGFALGGLFRLCYADNNILYGTSFSYDLLPEEQHIADSIDLPPEFSDQFTLEELEARTVYQSVTINLVLNEISKRPLRPDGGIYFEKSVVIMHPSHFSQDDEGHNGYFLGSNFVKSDFKGGETKTTIVLLQEDEPGMLVRYKATADEEEGELRDGKVEDICPGYYAVDGDLISYKVIHCGRTPYYVEHIRTQCMIQDIVRVHNLHNNEKTYYLLPFHAIASVKDLFILRERLFYITRGVIYDANNGACVATIEEKDINGIVADGDHIYYQEGDIIVKLFIGHRPYEILNREEWNRQMEAMRQLADRMTIDETISEMGAEGIREQMVDGEYDVVLEALLNGLPDSSFESSLNEGESSADTSFESLLDPVLQDPFNDRFNGTLDSVLQDPFDSMSDE